MIPPVAPAAGADPAVFLGRAPPAYVVPAVGGVLVGALAWATARAARPASLLQWLAPAVVAVPLIPGVLVGITSAGPGRSRSA